MLPRLAIVLAILSFTAGVAPASAAPAGEPIRIGFMAPLSGVFAQAGRDMLAGFQLGLEQAGYAVAGRKIELIVEDNEGQTATAVAKYRKLVTQDRIHLLAGILLVNTGYALVPLIERDQLPTLYLTTPDDLTKRRRVKWILRTNFAASQPMHAFGDYVANQLKYKRVATIALDNGFGHEQIGGFQAVFEANGGKVVQKLWYPLNALDFAPYLAQIRRDVDAVVSVNVAAQAVRFMQQYDTSALKGKVAHVGSGVGTDAGVLRALGREPIGVVSNLLWSAALPNAANQAFLKLVEPKVGKSPSYFTAIMYSAARWTVEGARLVNGDVDKRDTFLAAIKKAAETIEDPRGPIKFDEYNNPTENIYILRTDEVDGRLQNSVIHTYPMVSQFWTWSPEEFLKRPPYSRDYPPVSTN
jgi:branched-chain amino acid transport system substrate-binding protein